MSRKICVIGTGYVGLVAAVGLSDFGNSLIGIDIDTEKVEKLNSGNPVIYEPGINPVLKRNLQSGRLVFSSDIEYGIRNSEIIFIAVGTPPTPDGGADLSQISTVIDSLVEYMDSYKVIVTKSTVPVGTNRWISDELEKRSSKLEFDVVSNPEFLREGKACYDFFHPDRVVIGCESEKAKQIMEDVYRALNLISVPFVWCNLETAELIKYASNAYLATKITFINQMANLCEAIGADIHTVAKSMGMDGRISNKFLHPGPGYGGSCFPKDTKAIVHAAKARDVSLSLIESAISANEYQKKRMVEKLKKQIGGLESKTVAILGLSFKVETDDVRESPAISIVNDLLKAGAGVKAHDPKAIGNFKKLFPDVPCFKDEFEAVADSDAVIICTEWNEYRNIDMIELKKRMKTPVVLDTRNVLDSQKAIELGFNYEGVGRPVPTSKK